MPTHGYEAVQDSGVKAIKQQERTAAHRQKQGSKASSYDPMNN